MISEIVFKDVKDFEGYSTDTNSVILKNLSRINFFIGSNNSGKSRFMRRLFCSNEVGYNYEQVNMQALNNAIELYRQNIQIAFSQPYDNTKYVPEEMKRITMPYAAQRNSENLVEELLKRINIVKNFDKNRLSLIGNTNRNTLGNNYHSAATLLEDSFKLSASRINFFAGEYVYMPMLRGLRPLANDKGVTDYYEQRTRKDYFGGLNSEKHKIYTGQSLYKDLTNLLLGDSEDRNRVREFEKFISKEFFYNHEVNLIPKVKDDVVHVKIRNEEYPIHDLGDGIQALVIMLYPLFFNSGKQLMVFIEEPEHSLHPGFQRLFVETLHRPNFKDFQFFVTTHSNHFLDITEDDSKEISVYTFDKHNDGDLNNHFLIQNVSRRDMRSLELLGVRSSSVFLSNCTIWIEGVTDRLYISHYLDVYQDKLIAEKKLARKFKEDIHYSFIEYAGANITHWSFEDDKAVDAIKAVSITNKIFLIADSDDTDANPESEKAKRLKKLKSVLGDKFYKHSSREIENTLHEEVILRTIANKENKNIDAIRPKNFTQPNYANEKLGKFLKAKLKNVSGSYEGECGSLNDKKGFCKRAIQQIESIKDLSQESIDMCEKIIAFIQNSQV